MIFKRHVLVAAAIYLTAMSFFWFRSHAAAGVKLIDAVPLTFGFLAPALFLVRGAADFKSRVPMLLVIVLAVLFIYDVLVSQVIGTHDLFHLWFAMYPFGALLLMTLLYTHAVLSKPAA